MKIIDRFLACFMALGGLLHGVGSYLGYRNEPMTLLWALCASQAILAIAAINLLRTWRPQDRTLAWICFAGALSSATAAFTFGALIGNVFDMRALVNGLTALALAGFSLKTAMGAGRAAQ